MPTISNWSTPVAEVQRRLRKLDEVLHSARAADGSVDLVKARELAGKDQVVSRLVTQMRWERYGTSLTADQTARQFQELRQALVTVEEHDHNADHSLGFEELPYAYSDSKAHSLLLTAGMPATVVNGTRAAPRAWLSKEARLEAESLITERANHHARTPLGAEALKWEMRLSVVEGRDVRDPIVSDPLIYAEKDWRRFLPVIGDKYASGQGHLSDQELKGRYGPDLNAYIERTREKVNARLMMDYETQFLAGVDLP